VGAQQVQSVIDNNATDRKRQLFAFAHMLPGHVKTLNPDIVHKFLRFNYIYVRKRDMVDIENQLFSVTSKSIFPRAGCGELAGRLPLLLERTGL
jgi:hypothetical protein